MLKSTTHTNTSNVFVRVGEIHENISEIYKIPMQGACDVYEKVIWSGNWVRYGWDQELGPNKRGPACEAADYLWNESAIDPQMKYGNVLKHNWQNFRIETENARLFLGVLAAGQRVLVVSNTVLYRCTVVAFISGQIWVQLRFGQIIPSAHNAQS